MIEELEKLFSKKTIFEYRKRARLNQFATVLAHQDMDSFGANDEISTGILSIMRRLLIHTSIKTKQQSSTNSEKCVRYREVSLTVANFWQLATIRHAMTHWCWKNFKLMFLFVWCLDKKKNSWEKIIIRKKQHWEGEKTSKKFKAFEKSKITKAPRGET